MKVFAISDLHLSTSVEKPMDIFGDGWQNHFEHISADWNEKVSADDLVLLGGDISWGITIDEAKPDFALVEALPGKKVVVKGNHDYYWNSLSKMRTAFPQFDFLQNNAYRYQADGDSKGIVVAGTRGWNLPGKDFTQEDEKIYQRELIRIELSLAEAQTIRKDGDLLVVMMHFPPFDANYQDSEFTKIFEKYGVDVVLFGHLHGKNVRVNKNLKKNGIAYHLTSCDLVDNKLIEICDLH
ncbi:MAG: metallophosphoesterase [Clostridia bacterium]|nr:metallophosphoesterase [Clostridia bacterium]